jgi:sterile alpha motif and leucine zipper-containing kinase AZK
VDDILYSIISLLIYFVIPALVMYFPHLSQEVAVKKFLDQDVSGVALEQFKCEVSSLLCLPYSFNVITFEFLRQLSVY